MGCCDINGQGPAQQDPAQQDPARPGLAHWIGAHWFRAHWFRAHRFRAHRFRAGWPVIRGAFAPVLPVVAVLAACGLPVAEGPATAPRPAPPPATSPLPQPNPASTSQSPLRAEYARIEQRRVATGLLRTDGGGPDTPFTAAMLTENFIKIALYDEYVFSGNRVIARPTPSTLRRWEAPVSLGLSFGRSVPADVRTRDRTQVSAFVQRLARLTGHPVSLLPEGREGGANFHVLTLSEAERLAIGPELRRLLPGIPDASVGLITGMPRETFCMVLAFSRGGTDVYTDAVAVIRAEHPDLTRVACYHEELAQGLGLPNDSPQARPSIFNDGKEFARLTTHDEMLLQILYSPRLTPGMRESEARPIVDQLARELIGGES